MPDIKRFNGFTSFRLHQYYHHSVRVCSEEQVNSFRCDGGSCINNMHYFPGEFLGDVGRGEIVSLSTADLSGLMANLMATMNDNVSYNLHNVLQSTARMCAVLDRGVNSATQSTTTTDVNQGINL